MNNQDKMREEFEAWALKVHNYNGEVTRLGHYCTSEINKLWEAWKASRAALRVNLPMSNNDSQDAYFRELVDELETLGVNYK